MNILPDKAKVGNVILKKVQEGKAPEHYLWKKTLEREWAGEWGTLAQMTSYNFKIGLDPSFVEEGPEFKKGRINWYEWILCENGAIISLYSEKDRIGQIWTTSRTADKALGAGVGARLHLTSDERLSHVLHFPLDKIMEICELAGARRARRMSEERKAELRAQGLKRGFGTGPKGGGDRVSEAGKGQATECQRQAITYPI